MENTDLNTIEGLIRQGKIQEARLLLIQTTGNGRKMQRRHYHVISNLARRSGLLDFALRLLAPIVRPNRRKLFAPTPKEILEYAACLTRAGAVDEALLLIKSVKKEKLPETWLYTAYTHIAQWDYASAIPILYHYVKSKEVSTYQRLIGIANLIASLIQERYHQDVPTLIEELETISRENSYFFLHAKTLELAAENSIYQQDWSNTLKYLDNAKRILGSTDTIEEFFIHKWTAIALVLQTSAKAHALALLEEVKKTAHHRKHWETLRDCDRYQAIASKDQKLFLRVYFGTAFKCFRDRLIREMPVNEEDLKMYEWQHGDKITCRVDLRTGNVNGQNNVYTIGHLQHRTLCSLCSDFYRPLEIATIYQRLFPGEYYNPMSSPARVHQAIRRLRVLFNKSNIPLGVTQSAGTYRLYSNGCLLVVPADLGNIDKLSVLVTELSESLGSKPFKSAEAERALSLSHASTVRILTALVERGELKRDGSASKTIYTLPKKAA